jgi:hypothetical protein
MGRISMVDMLVITRLIILSLPPQLVFPETVFLVASDPSMNNLDP